MRQQTTLMNQTGTAQKKTPNTIRSYVPLHWGGGGIQQANPYTEIGIESVGLQDSCQVLMVVLIECLELIQIDQRGLFVVFYAFYDRANQIPVALNYSVF